jgi:hypothetical protein
MERGNSDIYVAEADGGGLSRLTSHTSEDILPDWSHDGNWIYFVSKRTGAHQIWKVPARGGPEVQVTQRGGWEPRADPAGVFIYYTAAAAPAEFRKVSVEGGEEVPAISGDDRRPVRSRCPRSFAAEVNGIYFLYPGNQQGTAELRFFDTRNARVRVITQVPDIDFRYVCGFDISRDGSWIVYNPKRQHGGDIMLSGNFR